MFLRLITYNVKNNNYDSHLLYIPCFLWIKYSKKKKISKEIWTWRIKNLTSKILKRKKIIVSIILLKQNNSNSLLSVLDTAQRLQQQF